MAKMLYSFAVAGFLLITGFTLPTSPRPIESRASPSSVVDITLQRASPLPKGTRHLNTDFKYVFLSQNASLSFHRGLIGEKIEINGSPKTSMAAVYQAANYVSKMIKHMSKDIFRRLASNSSVGVFSADEKLTVYPEYAHFKNPNCGSSCFGACSMTCSSDGRRLEDLAGIGGQRAVVLDDNVLCTPRDPYGHRENILVHEFAHTIHQYALSSNTKALIRSAYLNAKSNSTWTTSSYAMSNYLEYFAEGAAVFFGVDVDDFNTGGMNTCGSSSCGTESSARRHLQSSDPLLYDILSYVFTANHPGRLSGLTICPDETPTQNPASGSSLISSPTSSSTLMLMLPASMISLIVSMNLA